MHGGDLRSMHIPGHQHIYTSHSFILQSPRYVTHSSHPIPITSCSAPSNHDHPTIPSPSAIPTPPQTMAPSKPPQDSDTNQKYQPVTSSPLNPGNNTSTPSQRSALSAEPTTPTPTNPTCTTKHRRRTWSSISPTERLLRHKAAAAWRSATLRRDILRGSAHSFNSNDTPGTKTVAQQITTTTSSSHHDEEPDFHVVTLKIPDNDDEVTTTTVAKGHVTDRECADYTAIFRPRRQGQGQGYMYSRATMARAGTTLQRVSVVAVVLLLGVYLLLRALVFICHGTFGWCSDGYRLTA